MPEAGLAVGRGGMTSGPRASTMRAAEVVRPGESRVVERDRPAVGPGEVLIGIRRAGICGTDMHIWHGAYELARFPLVPGHEFSGVVEATGAGVTRFEVGDRVTADPNVPCLTCAECRRNMFNQCRDLIVVGITRAGAFAEYVCVPERVVFGIGDLSFAAGALVEPLACVAWGLKRVEVRPGDRAIVFGAGPMGCLLMQAVRAAGASSVTVVDREPSRLALAAELGASHVLEADAARPGTTRDIAPHGFELVVDATGVAKVVEGAPAYARSGGTIWVFGVAPEDAFARFRPYELFRRDLRVIGSFAVNQTFPDAIALIEGGAVQVEPLVSHVVPLESFAEGLRLAERDPDRMKVQYAMDESE